MEGVTLELLIGAFALLGLATTCAVAPGDLSGLASRLVARLSRRDPGPPYQI